MEDFSGLIARRAEIARNLSSSVVGLPISHGNCIHCSTMSGHSEYIMHSPRVSCLHDIQVQYVKFVVIGTCTAV